MRSQIDVEGLQFEQIEETHASSMTEFMLRCDGLAVEPVTNESEHLGVIDSVKALISDMQNYLSTLSVKDHLRGAPGISGTAFCFEEGNKTATA